MPVYERASHEVEQLAKATMKKYHGRLEDAGLTLDVLFARPTLDKDGDPNGPALTHNGYPAAAKVRIVSHKERAAGRADAEITIDADGWDERGDGERAALLDHELTHLDLAEDKEGNAKRDDMDRPKLKMRKHDWNFGWFHEVVRRHGEASIEHRQAKTMRDSDEWKQLYLPFDDAVPAAVSMPRRQASFGATT